MKSQTPRGTRDFLPEEMRRREFVFDTVRSVFRRFGFGPVETPAFESWDLLSAKGSGGEELKKEIYYFKDKSERELGLRFDLTVPLARVIANNPQLPKPFKRYQIGRVWRYDRPQAGRWREFWQADIDIVGSSGTGADAECLAAVVECLKKLGFRDFVIRVNSRKILDGLLDFVGIKKDKTGVFRSLDKLEKIGERNVISELKGMGVENKKTETLMKLIKKRGLPENVLKKERSLLKGVKLAHEGLNDTELLYEKSKSYGISDKIILDFSLVRGLDYYTGLIFEIFIKGKENLGSVSAGGRYDNLIGLYGGRPTPATGISLGIDRIYEIMASGKMFVSEQKRKLFIISATGDKAVEKYVLNAANVLRKSGLEVETDLMGRSLKRNLEYADSSGADYVVIAGREELKQKKFILKNMKSKRQKLITLKQIQSALK